jgi:Putative papain-like cysteine peptidase (DUF1796)
MKTKIVSLGSACDVGIALQWMRIKEESYPFDWIGNGSGLKAVVDILENNFETVNKPDCYEMRYFSRFEKTYLVYKNHPEIMHLHSNPLENRRDHDALVRRMERFQVALEDENLSIDFLYYVNFDELRVNVVSLSLEEAFELLKAEGQCFAGFLRKGYPSKRFNLTLIIQANDNLTDEVTRLIAQANTLNDAQGIKYGFTITRSDDSARLRALWRTQWCQIVYCGCSLSLRQRIRVVWKWFQQTISLFFKNTER